uniref:Etoposide-induced protein 2.4 n=1 Tax=Ceratitis capitata TaxID=7213 RepID=W8C9T8_CERCA
METIKNITFAMLYGILDSIKGIKLLFQIDEEMNKIDAKEEETKQRRNAARERRAYRRTPSPTPSSAAAMAREELKELLQLKEQTNPNERRLSSMIKRSKNTDLQGPKLERKIATKFIKCCGFNIGCTWICMMFFEYGILPALKYLLSLFYGADTTELNMVWEWVRPVSNATFQIGWIGPICALCRVLSLLWFSDIADAAYRVRRESPQTMPNVTKYYADFLFGLIVQWLFLFQSWIVNYIPIPYIGVVLSNFHLCLLHALCSFEYKWFNMGWELHRRLSYIENNWPYFIGFGLPLTILTNLSESFILNGCAFCVFFPLFILSGYEAIPIVDSVNFPVRLFTPIIFCTNLIFNRFKPPRLSAVKLAQQKKHLIIQKEKELQQHKLLQQEMEDAYLGRSRSRQTEYQGNEEPYIAQRSQSTRYSHSPSPSPVQYRYQQPPAQPRVPSTTRQFMGQVPISPALVPRTPSSESSSVHTTQTVRHR